MDNLLYIRVYNISGEVLDYTSRPYELILLYFTIKIQSSKVRFECKINAKYANGMSCYKPREGSYKNMDNNPQYQNYIPIYGKKITNELNKFLKK